MQELVSKAKNIFVQFVFPISLVPMHRPREKKKLYVGKQHTKSSAKPTNVSS